MSQSSFSRSASSSAMASTATTPPSSIPDDDEYTPESESKNDTSKSAYNDIRDLSEEARFERLTYLLEKSSAYSRLLKDRMDMMKAKHHVQPDATTQAGQKRRRGAAHGGSKCQKGDDYEVAESTEKHEDGPKFPQPALLTGAKLKDYQLDGVAWMVGLYENGISGILADEMGLGKTIQTIAFHAYLRERVNSPFLVVCPLSVLHNWIDEFQKFAPSIPVCMYHGTPEDRKELRRTVMRPPLDGDEEPPKPKPKRGRPSKGAKTGNRQSNSQTGAQKQYPEHPTQDAKNFPVVITTYEMIIKDRKFLANYKWGYIVVDEGHRLKNFDCKLVQEIKKYESAGRMILTGTPLHNNLGELWSLLNFILPDIFGDFSSFQEWFNLPSMQSNLPSEQSTHLITTLHSILKPFLLRRLKADVEYNLPPKKEYVLYAPLTQLQRNVYQAILDGALRRYLIGDKQKIHGQEETQEEVSEEEKPTAQDKRKLRKNKIQQYYDLDSDDETYFEQLESGELREKQENIRRMNAESSMTQIGLEYHRKAAVKQVNNLHLQNMVMQMRKVCSHPFLFDWPIDPMTNDPIVNEELVNASGKMMVLDRLLTELFRRKHKVLLFSQFTTMLDIIEAWATESKNWRLCRIDGSSKPMERREEMNRFQTGGNSPDAPCLFLLSTRAGGLGINLTAADTVVFYDQDWNPQMDIQAQDRAHRIGQTKPVLIFRLVSAHTIETTIMTKAHAKRRLETMVIAKGRFKMPTAQAPTGRGKESMADIAAELLKLEGEKIDVVPKEAEGKARVVLSDEDLDVLLDRSPEVFADRREGWTRTTKTTAAAMDEIENKKVVKGPKMKKAFEVFAGRTDETSDTLAKMLGEDEEALEDSEE